MSSTPVFNDYDRNDLHELYRVFDFAKCKQVDQIINDCAASGTTPQQLFSDLYALHRIAPLPDRRAAQQRLRCAVSTAAENDVESALRRAEIHGFAECDALRSLRRQLGVRHVSGIKSHTTSDDGDIHRSNNNNNNNKSRSSNTTVNNDSDSVGSRPVADQSNLTAAPTRAAVDEILAAECREWVANVVGGSFNAAVLSESNFVDALRSGVVLHILLQKLREPPVEDAGLSIPKRSTGFYARDNVASFLKEAASRYNLVDAQLFTASDLCDGKNDRAVVTCLLAIASIAYTIGSTHFAPAVIVYEQEIESQQKMVTQEQIDRLVQEGEGEEEAGQTHDDSAPEGSNEEEEEREKEKEEEKVQKEEKQEQEEEKVEEEKESVKDQEEEKEVVVETAENDTRDVVEVISALPIPGVAKNDDALEEEREVFTPESGPSTERNESPENGGKVFYLRNGALCTDLEKIPPPHSPPSKPSPEVQQRLSGAAASKNKKNAALPEAPKYHPRKWDEIDLIVASIVNAHFAVHPYSQVRFRRLSGNTGEYVVYHRLSGMKRLLYVRILQQKLMIRLATRGNPSWVDFKSWLEEYEGEDAH